MAHYARITIKEIAQEAGVSKQTVSRVINNRPDVSDKTRQRVQAIIDRNGYQPSSLARSLTRGRTYTLGVVCSDLQHFGPSQTLTGINQQARQFGYALSLSLIHNLEEVNVKSILGNLVAQHVDGIIWAPVVGREGKMYQHVLAESAELAVPMVVNGEPGFAFTAVYSDSYAGAQLATDHLLEQGYQTIGIITGPMHEWSARQRLAGWQHALRMAHRPIADSLMAYGEWTAVSGYLGLQQLLARRSDIDAVFVSNDQMALGALKAAQECGRAVPHDLGVVGYDDIPEASYFNPPLTTVQQDLGKIGRLLVQALDQQIQNQDMDNFPPQIIEIPTKLIIRASTRKSGYTDDI